MMRLFTEVGQEFQIICLHARPPRTQTPPPVYLEFEKVVILGSAGGAIVHLLSNRENGMHTLQ